MNLYWYDFVGFFGVLLTLSAYLALQARRMRGDGLWYPLLNLVGAAAILVSIWYDVHTNLSALAIELAWCVISVYGIWQCLRPSKPPADR